MLPGLCLPVCLAPLAPSKLCVSLFSTVQTNLSSSLLCLKYESDELEKSVYQDYDSDSDVPEELKQDYVDEQTGDAPLKRSVPRWVSLQALSDAQHRSAKALQYSPIYLQRAKIYF